ncbi:MAG: enoyl-CoA hydratase/isomerase family protein [Aeromicrobium sp.]|uniref:enoyl-CoA hydratase/isomerase family protein n=1 Tax=Aeromicrobium sp. TaxID=1871063 RepID=UPI002620AA2A|nr:enoyl-CoA hydratase/isomerase family protein [Aeromicrobium sp.]MDF1705306.1 enoyl-CoA hydratase/isomerase family protein [Aeromicrobium sp.]
MSTAPGSSGVVVLRPGEVEDPDDTCISVLVLGPEGDVGPGVVDLVVAPEGSPAAEHREVVGVPDVDAAIDTIRRRVAERPLAAGALARLLPRVDETDMAQGLALESRTFSALLAGPEFAAWLAGRGASRPPGDPHRVQLERIGDELTITLDRPSRRNAYDAMMRDALLEALEVARLDPDVRVTLKGAGPDFCAGGDLDEFGTAHDLDAAHETRVAASPGALVHALRDRVTVHVHGHAVGSGIEIAAFAGQVRADADARFALPEVAMGLVPGAGGTVSLSRRIGRHRLLWWGLTGAVLDAATAHRWGLVDELVS